MFIVVYMNCVCVHVRFTVPYYTIEEHSIATTSCCNKSLSPVVQPTDEQAHSSASGSESLPTTPVLATPLSKCGSVGFSLGTPIEAGTDTPHAAAKSLPDRSQFAIGISDHILYENLENATGTFKRLRKVIRSLHSSTPASISSPH